MREMHDERRVVRRLDPELLEGRVDGGVVLGIGAGHVGRAVDVEHDVVVVSGGARIDQAPPGGHEVGGHDVAAVGVLDAVLQVEGDGLAVLADVPGIGQAALGHRVEVGVEIDQRAHQLVEDGN